MVDPQTTPVSGSLVRRLTRLNLMVMAASMVLVFALITLLLWFTMRERQAQTAEISIAQLAHNIVPMLVFGDRALADKELSLVGSHDEILFLSVRRSDGSVFASYNDVAFVPAGSYFAGIHSKPRRTFSGLHLLLSHPISMQNQQEGEVIMVMDMTNLLYWFLRLTLILAGLITLLFTASAWFIARIQKQSLAPLLSLTSLAQKVSREHNFQLRAQVVREDEIGILTQRFNELLKRVDKWQGELNQQLEQEQLQGQQLKQMVLKDPLTGLANRLALNTRLQRLTADEIKPEQLSCLMFIDLDNFKYVNDHYGHEAGDEILVTIGKRIQALVRETDLLCRLGGDEFALLLPGISSTESAEKLAERIVFAINTPIEIKQNIMPVGISVGLAYYPTDAIQPMTLLNCADEAMYSAKRAGKNTFRTFRENAQ